MIFASFFAPAARIESCADAWPRLIAASLVKKTGYLPNRCPDEQCRPSDELQIHRGDFTQRIG
jgi:hypothetical protein